MQEVAPAALRRLEGTADRTVLLLQIVPFSSFFLLLFPVLLLHPGDGDRCYVADWRDGGPWRTIDHGPATVATAIAFDAGDPDGVWVATAAGPQAVNVAVTSPILVPPMHTAGTPWATPGRLAFAQNAVRQPPAVPAAPEMAGPAAVAVAGGYGVCVVATATALYIGCAERRATVTVAIPRVVAVAALTYVCFATATTLYVADRVGTMLATMPCVGVRGLVATATGARAISNGRPLTIILGRATRV